MLKTWIFPLLFTVAPPGLAAQPANLSVKVIDSQTGAPVANARIIINHGEAPEPSSAEMIQKNREFRPKSLMVPTGSRVNFPNRDNTQHHVYSFSPARTFNIELYAGQPEDPVLFDSAGVVEVGCNIHDQMQGFILVTGSSLTAGTNASGIATIKLPVEIANRNALDLSLWHSRLQNATETADFTVSLPAPNPVELALDLKPERKEAGRLDGLRKRFQDL